MNFCAFQESFFLHLRLACLSVGIKLEATVPGSMYMDLYANQVIEDPYMRYNDLNYSKYADLNWQYSSTFQGWFSLHSVSAIFELGFSHHLLSLTFAFMQLYVFYLTSVLLSAHRVCMFYTNISIVVAMLLWEHHQFLSQLLLLLLWLLWLQACTVITLSKSSHFHYK